MHLRNQFLLVSVLVAAFTATGCGMPDKITYVDPNPPTALTAGAAIQEPVGHFGAHVIERHITLMRLHARLLAARAAVTGKATPPSSDLIAARDTEWALLQPVLLRTNAPLAGKLDKQIAELADAGDAATAAQIDQVSATTEQAEAALSPRATRDDPGYRAATLHEAIAAASIAYEQALAGGNSVASITDYHLAYGLLSVARDLTSSALEGRPASLIQSRIDRIAVRATPGPTPPDEPVDSATVSETLASLEDRIDEATNIDTTRAEPQNEAIDDLADVQAALKKSAEGPERERVLQLNEAWLALQKAAPTVAAVDPTLLTGMEQLLAITLTNNVEASDYSQQVTAAITSIGEARETVASEVALFEEDE